MDKAIQQEEIGGNLVINLSNRGNHRRGDQIVGMGSFPSLDVRLNSDAVGDTDEVENGCTFKHGGKCNKHGIMGEKKTVTKLVWQKTKYGTYKYVIKRQTSYSCVKNKNMMHSSNASKVVDTEPRSSAVGNISESEVLIVHLHSGTNLLGISESDNCGAGAIKGKVSGLDDKVLEQE